MAEQFPRDGSMALTIRNRTKTTSANWWLLLALSTSQITAALNLPQERYYRLDISEQWAVFVDATGSATLDEVRGRRNDFIPASRFQAPLPPLQNYWLRLSLQNPGPQKKISWLEMDAPLARNIMLYHIDGPYIKTHGISLNDSEGVPQRQALAHFSIAIPAESTTEIYVNLSRPWRAQFAASLSDPRSHQKSTDKRLLIAGFCFGGLLLLTFGALLMSWKGGRPDYLLLALLAVAATLYAAVYQGVLLQLAAVNNSGSQLLQLAPLCSQTAFIIALLLWTRSIQTAGAAGRALRYIQWGGIVVGTSLLLIALFDFGLAYYGLALTECLTLLILLLYFIVLLAQGRYRLIFIIAGLVLYSLGSWPLLSGILSPVTGFHGSGATSIADLSGTTLYQAGLLLMLLLFAIGQATLARHDTRQPGPDTDDIDPDVEAADSLALEHLTGSSMPDWWRLTEASFDGVLLCEHGRVLYTNQSAAELLGYEKAELIGKPLSLLVGSGSDSEALLSQAAIKPVMLNADTGNDTHRRLELRSRQQWVEHRQLDFVSLRGLAGGGKGSSAFYDGLTGLAGQQLLSERVEQAIKTADRNPASHALLAVQLDQLQPLKQRYGRERTDRLLQALATRLDQSTRRENTVARVEEAQFVAFVEHIDNAQVAAKVAQQLLQTLSRPVHIDERDLLTSASIGIAVFPQDGDNLPQLLQVAEQAAQTAGRRGANQYHFHSDELNRRVAAQLNIASALVKSQSDLVSSLHDAQRRSSFILSLEAVMELQGQNRIGSKAGLRWPGSPADCRPIDRLYALAREVNLDRDISTCMLQVACEFAAEPTLDYNAGLLCIKIAEAHFWQQDFTDDVHDRVTRSGCIPQQIMLIFDEAMLASQVKQSIHKLRQLEQIGCLVGIDHFAENHTSLLLLRSCAINQVSITTSWIKSMGTQQQDLKTICALIKLCHRMQMQVLVDQVSTENHLKVARLIDCDRASGPLIEQMLH
jgi:diguanylate cyclase (GGDEF)-like protein